MTQQLFYNGFVVTVLVENVPSDRTKSIVRVVEDLTLDRDQQHKVGMEMYVKSKHLQPLIYELFVVGAHVRNVKGSMIGKITAFEYHTNTAVVISDKIDRYEQKKTRYVYTVEELEEYEQFDTTFKPGQWYMINKRYKLLAVQSVFELDQVMLFNLDGDLVYRGLPKKCNLDWLKVKHCINRVKQA